MSTQKWGFIARKEIPVTSEKLCIFNESSGIMGLKSHAQLSGQVVKTTVGRSICSRFSDLTQRLGTRIYSGV
jgi:hypothetical protein